MVALIQDLAYRSRRIFHHAAEAASRSAVVSFDSLLKTERVPENRVSPDESQAFPFRERAVLNEVANSCFINYNNLTAAEW